MYILITLITGVEALYMLSSGADPFLSAFMMLLFVSCAFIVAVKDY